MKASDFAYARAATVADAFRLKAELGVDARWLAGGQSLLASLAFRLSEPSALIDISGLAELQGVARVGDCVRIGAATTYAALARSDIIRTQAPLIAEALPHIAHTAIRNRGTIGGSLAYGDPAAELPACAVALEATLVLARAGSERRVAAGDFYHGLFATALGDDELLVAIEVPVWHPDQQQTIVEVTRRAGDYAMAGVAVALTRGGDVTEAVRLVFFALGDCPVVANAAAAALVGNPLDDVDIERAVAALGSDLDPAADLNGGVATKRHLAAVVLRRALHRLVPPHGERAS